MKKLLSLVLSLSFFFSLCACSADNAASKYKDDVSVADLADEVSAVNSNWNFTSMTDSYISGAMKLDVSQYSDYIVNMNALGTNVDEFGIFKAKDESSVSALKDDVSGYLQLRLDNWMEEYMPEEKPKLENAEIKVCGLYVMYAILDDTSRVDAFSAFENYLQK